MNQAIQTNERMSMNSIGMADTGAGSKIAPQNLAEVVKFAEVMSRADIALPKHLRGNAGACMAVAMQALDWSMNPFAVASKSYEVGGRIAYEAQLIAAVVNTRSGIKGRLRYSFDGEGAALTCTVTGTLDGDECVYMSPPIGSITTKNSPLWKSDPQQQLGYFAARSWARRHCPEVILGVYDRDEVEEFRGPDAARDVTPRSPVMERLQARAATALPSETTEGFSASHVQRETESVLSGEIIDTNTGEVPSSPADDAPVTQASSQEPDRPSAPDLGSNGEPAEHPIAPAAAAGSSSDHQPIPEKELVILRTFARDALKTATTLPNDEGMKKVINRWLNGDLVNVKTESGLAAIKSIRLSVAAIMRNDGEVDFNVVLGEHANGLGCSVEELGG